MKFGHKAANLALHLALYSSDTAQHTVPPDLLRASKGPSGE